MPRFLTATLLAALIVSPALAGEGEGEPFPFTAPGHIATAEAQGFDVGRNALPTLPEAYSFAYNGAPTFGPNSREGEVQTAGSLPRNALAGTVEYAQQQSIARWFASRPSRRNVAVLRSGGFGG